MTVDRLQSALPRLSLCVLGLAWLVPFLQPYHRFPFASFYNEWLSLALGLAAALLLLRRESWPQDGVPALAAAPFGLILLLGLQVALGRAASVEQALLAVQYLAWAVLLALLGRVLQRDLGLDRASATLAWFLLAGGLLSAAAGFVQLYDIQGPLGHVVSARGGSVIYGNLAQPNHFAAYLAMGCASAGLLYARGRLHGAGAAACLCLILPALALAGSRSSWLYLSAFTALAAIWHRAQRDAASRRLAVFCLSLVPAFVLAQWATALPSLQPERAVVTSAQRLFELASGVESRVQLAGEAWRMFLQAPAIGVGWGQFAWWHFLYTGDAGPGVVPGITNHAHNIVLHLLAETGVAGGLLLAGAAWLWFRDLWRANRDAEWWWLVAVLAVVCIHSLLEFPLWYAYFLAIVAPLAGLGSGAVIPVRRAGAARAVAALFILSGAINLAGVLASYREFERLIFDPRLHATRTLTDGEFAQVFERVQREPALAHYAELVLAHGIKVTPERLAEKLDLNTRVMRWAPVNIVVYHQAMLLALAGEDAAARRQLERAARAYPGWLEEALPQLEDLARRHPAEFTPLLELAAAGRAQPGGVGALEDDARRR